MLTFILRRLASAVPTLFVIITIAFFLMRLAPGGPFDLERPLEAKVMENLNRIYKLDRPLLEQYWLYLSALLRGDLGPSFYYRDFSVAELLARGLPVSIAIGLSALILALVSGLALGVVAALRQNAPADYAVIERRYLRHHRANFCHRACVADPVRADAGLAAGGRLE